MKYIYFAIAIICFVIAFPFGLISALFLWLGSKLSDKALDKGITRYPNGSYTVKGSDHIYNDPNRIPEPKPTPVRTLIKDYTTMLGKKVCVNKVDGQCPLHNLHCSYPKCEQ